MTVSTARQKTIEALLSRYDLSEASSITRILFEDYFHFFNDPSVSVKEFSTEQETDLASLTTKLLEGEPVQYLVGKAHFYGLFFKVNPTVLIPRSEPEELVYLILESTPTTELQIGIDIGTGSGCIPITLKHKRPNWEIHASDISSEAINIAQENARSSNTEIDFHTFDVLNEKSWPKLPIFDFVVSNPPYIPPSEKRLMPDSVIEHEPELALFAPEDDPLVFYRKIINFAKQHLKAGGQLFFEGNEFNARKVLVMMQKNEFVDVLLEKDMQGKDRMVVGRKNA